MKIGCVKEIKNNEFRVGLTPDNVKAYIAAGHHVYMEKGAGLGSGFTDNEYVDAGASLIDNAADVWHLVDMMVKVKEPLEEEYPLFHEGLILYTYLHLAADKQQMDALLKGRVKAVAYETIQEKDRSLPCLAPMSQIAGRLSIQEGAKYLEKRFGGEGILLAGVPVVLFNVPVGIALIAVGAVGLILTQGREKKGIVGKIIGGVGSLYGITGYMSDILSYSRILALGLSAGVIGSVFNKLGSLGGANFIGVILFIIIFVIGHILNLALSTLGAYVHASRLQFIEFFSKFYESGGRKFDEFGIQLKYTELGQ